jgi:hypothetical protein
MNSKLVSLHETGVCGTEKPRRLSSHLIEKLIEVGLSVETE